MTAALAEQAPELYTLAAKGEANRSMPFCHSCGTALERGAVCSACGSTFQSGVSPIQQDSHGAAVSAALEADRRVRLRLGLAVAVLGMLLLGIVVVIANRSSPDESPVSATGVSAKEAKARTAAPENSPSEQTASPVVVREQTPRDHVLQEDGRVYSVALIVATPEIPPGAKLFAQGRVLSFGYADAMRSWRYAIIEDEQQPGKTLMCAMRGEEGVEVFSLYHLGEVVAVSGEYIDTVGVNGYPRVALTNCHVAGPQDYVVRPVEIAHPANAEKRQESPRQTVEKGQTPEQVQAILGKPDEIVNLGSKMIYVYKDLRVTFLNDEVFDAQ